MKTYTVKTNGICAMQISFSLDKGNIYNINFIGGCPGNTSALSKILEGTNAQRVVDLLKGTIVTVKEHLAQTNLQKPYKRLTLQAKHKLLWRKNTNI